MGLQINFRNLANIKEANICVASFIIGSTFTAFFFYYTYHFPKSGAQLTKSKDKQVSETLNEGSLSLFENEPTQIRTNDTCDLTLNQRNEQLSNTLNFFGYHGLFSITNASILIVGLGGVGSHVAQMLARVGIRYLRLIDFDQVTLSSLNRHSCATLRDVGTPKALTLKKYLEQICPNRKMLDIDAHVRMFTGDEEYDGNLMTHPSILRGGNESEKTNWDYIIDAIDDVPTKAKLLAYCIRNNIRVISCMSSGGKSDITRIHISDLRSAICDPLAKKVRLVLKKIMYEKGEKQKYNGGSFIENIDQITVVYSSENIVVNLADFTEEQHEQGVYNFGAIPHMRTRVLPVVGTMPAIMGQTIAGLALCHIGNKPFSPISGKRVLRHTSHKIFQCLKNREKNIKNKTIFYSEETNSGNHALLIDNFVFEGSLQVDLEDIEYSLDDVWGNRCCVTGESTQTILQLVRWDLRKPCNCKNLVLLGLKALERFDDYQLSTGDGRNSIYPKTRNKIIMKLGTCRINSRL